VLAPPAAAHAAGGGDTAPAVTRRHAAVVSGIMARLLVRAPPATVLTGLTEALAAAVLPIFHPVAALVQAILHPIAAPVEVGTIFWAAARARRKSLCGPSCRF